LTHGEASQDPEEQTGAQRNEEGLGE
jgi:hypothetical protein